MDYSIILIAIFFLLVYSFNFWHNYFRKNNDLTDKQLMDNYVYLKTKGYLND